jgi:hypothetical protein
MHFSERFSIFFHAMRFHDLFVPFRFLVPYQSNPDEERLSELCAGQHVGARRSGQKRAPAGYAAGLAAPTALLSAKRSVYNIWIICGSASSEQLAERWLFF